MKLNKTFILNDKKKIKKVKKPKELKTAY